MLFRPLRLCLSGEQLRRGRIWLLKITHFPYVGAIWAYESVVRHLDGDGVESSSRWYALSRSQPRQRAPFVRRERRSGPAKGRALRRRSELSLATHPAADARPDWVRANEPDDLDSLNNLKPIISKLSRQLEQLTSQLEQQHAAQVQPGGDRSRIGE